MTDFEKYDVAFRKNDMCAFNGDPLGLLWLKVRAISRTKIMEAFLSGNSIELSSKTVSGRAKELYAILVQRADSIEMLDRFLRVKCHEWYDSQGIDENKVKDNLYKVRHYEWGGDYTNSLDKYLVGRYVKAVRDYDTLVEQKGEIASNAWSYVQASWYNNWTSYLIESLFKTHSRVVPSVGEIKNVDFFIGGIPLDLKVTYFPKQLMDEKLKLKLGKKELPWLASKAKELGVFANKDLSDAQKLYVLREKLCECGYSEVVDSLNAAKRKTVKDAESGKRELITWLYSNQGEMRFGAENRIYLILADLSDMDNSWKMKRAFSVLEPGINEYLDSFDENKLEKVDFTFKNSDYKSYSDALFVIKE